MAVTDAVGVALEAVPEVDGVTVPVRVTVEDLVGVAVEVDDRGH